MEYASLHNFLNLLKKLVISQLQSTNITNREWAKIYEIDLYWKSNSIKPSVLMDLIKKSQVKTDEMMFMQQFLEFNSYYLQKEFGLLDYNLQHMEHLIGQIQDPFLTKSFYTRFNFALANLYLVKDEIEKARHHAQLVIDDQISLEKVARMYHLLGLSYTFENYEKALQNLYKSKKIFESQNLIHQVQNVNQSVLFVSNHWGKRMEWNETNQQPGYLQEMAHQQLILGNTKKAKSILKKIDEKQLDIRAKAFQYYYLGLCDYDIDLFYKSATLFNQCGDKFFGKLPCLELLKTGERESAVAAAYGKSLNNLS